VVQRARLSLFSAKVAQDRYGASMTKAGKNDIRAAESIDFGTYRFPMNPTAYTNVRKNAK